MDRNVGADATLAQANKERRVHLPNAILETTVLHEWIRMTLPSETYIGVAKLSSCVTAHCRIHLVTDDTILQVYP